MRQRKKMSEIYIFLMLSTSKNARVISSVDSQTFWGLYVDFKQLSCPFCFHIE